MKNDIYIYILIYKYTENCIKNSINNYDFTYKKPKEEKGEGEKEKFIYHNNYL